MDHIVWTTLHMTPLLIFHFGPLIFLLPIDYQCLMTFLQPQLRKTYDHTSRPHHLPLHTPGSYPRFEKVRRVPFPHKQAGRNRTIFGVRLLGNGMNTQARLKPCQGARHLESLKANFSFGSPGLSCRGGSRPGRREDV